MAVRLIGAERVFVEHRGLLHAVAYRVLGGGFTGAPRKPIRGIVYVARAIVVLSKRRPAGSDARLLPLNGGPGIVIYADGTPVLAFTLHLAGGAIKELHAVSNPEKLRGVMT
jgi:hypothetical protein